jgi:mRNA-degrading endonuclease toxin of MazEF toxin-antitoxin module
VPLSSKAPEIWPFRVRVDVPGAKTSFVVIPGIRQVSRARLHELIGDASPGVMARIDEALSLYLGE